MLLHEARIIATKERIEMKTIEFFIAGEIVVDGAEHSITNRHDSSDRNEAGKMTERDQTNAIVSERMYASVLKLT